MRFKALIATLFVAGILGAPAAQAQTEILWWHSMGGALGEKLNALATKFNASQSDYKVVPIFKGSYPESMTAAFAAFRAGNAPHLLQVFEDSRTRPIEVGAVLEHNIDIGVAKHGLRPHRLDVRRCQQAGHDGVRHLIFNHIRRLALPPGMNDDLHVGYVWQRVERNMLQRPDAGEYQ